MAVDWCRVDGVGRRGIFLCLNWRGWEVNEDGRKGKKGRVIRGNRF